MSIPLTIESLYGGGFWRKLRGPVKHSERLRKLNRVACRRGRAELKRDCDHENSFA